MRNKLVKNLNSGWTFKKKSDNNWLEAEVPGCIHTDLLYNRKIEDPFVGLNENKLQWIADEKWIYKSYIKTYKNIEPTSSQFISFLNSISKNNKIIIVNGYLENKLLQELKIKNYINENKNIVMKDKINIFELQFLIKHSDCLITCHGAPSHIASNYNIKVIDIVDNSEINFFKSYNYHFRNKVQIIRDEFNRLEKKIIENI